MASHAIGITVGVMQILTVCQRPFLFSPRVLSFTLTHVFFFLLSSNVTFTAADIFSKSFHLLSLEIWFYHLNTIQWTSIYFGSGGQTVAWAGMSLIYISGIFSLINWCIFWIMYFSHWNNSLIWIMLHFAIFLNTRCADTALWTSVHTWTSVLWAFFHPMFPPLVFPGWLWRQSWTDQDTPALALPSDQLAHIKSNQPQHKSLLLLSFSPRLLLCACGIFNWALEGWMCFYLLVSVCFWICLF